MSEVFDSKVGQCWSGKVGALALFVDVERVALTKSEMENVCSYFLLLLREGVVWRKDHPQGKLERAHSGATAKNNKTPGDERCGGEMRHRRTHSNEVRVRYGSHGATRNPFNTCLIYGTVCSLSCNSSDASHVMPANTVSSRMQPMYQEIKYKKNKTNV